MFPLPLRHLSLIFTISLFIQLAPTSAQSPNAEKSIQASLDAKLASILDPDSDHHLSWGEIVRVNIINAGSTQISGIAVTYCISGDTITEWCGDNIQVGDSVDYTFSTRVDLFGQGSYHLRAWLTLQSDSNQLNDTLDKIIINSPFGYCNSYSINQLNGCDIGNVIISGVSNGNATPSTQNALANNDYSDFMDSIPPIPLGSGTSYPFSLSQINQGGINSPSVIKVFIDLNRNGILSDPSELVFTGYTSYFSPQVSGNIVIPDTLAPGLALLRVVLMKTNNAAVVLPCGIYSDGETEDYPVLLYKKSPFDAGITAINQPNGNCPANTSVNVEATLHNYGTDTITNCTIAYVHNDTSLVTEQWNGTLTPGASEPYIFQTPLTTLTKAANIYCISIAEHDSNYHNDIHRTSYYGVISQDAGLSGLSTLSKDPCEIGQESIIAHIFNHGVDTLSGLLILILEAPALSTYIIDSISATIPPNDTIEHIFSQVIDMTAYSGDTIWEMTAWTIYPGDIEYDNDTAQFEIFARQRPQKPISTNDTTLYGQPVMLTAASQDSIHWYYEDYPENIIASGNEFATPRLYRESVFLVAAQSGLGTDTLQIGNGNGTQTIVPFDGNCDFGWSCILIRAEEIASPGNIKLLLWEVANSTTYAMTDQYIYIAHTSDTNFSSTQYPGTSGMTQVFEGNITWTGKAWCEIILDQPFEYNGQDNLLILYENRDGSSGFGWPEFCYTNTPYPMAIYKNDPVSFPTGLGSSTLKRPNIKIFGPKGCLSEMVADTVFVTDIPYYDAAILRSDMPSTSSVNFSTEQIRVYIKNYGLLPISSVNFSFQLEDGIVYTETIYDTIQSLSEYIYVTQHYPNLSNYGPHHIKMWLSHAEDSITHNDSLVRVIIHQMPTYCPSSARYGSNYEDIGNVSISNLNNGNPIPVSNNPTAVNAYSDFRFSVPPVILTPDSSYAISVSAISIQSLHYSSMNVEVYIDYNQDGNFNVLAEKAFSGSVHNANPSATGTITVPGTALPGNTLMRVVLDRQGSSAPCGLYNYGETEDYLVQIIPSVSLPDQLCTFADSSGHTNLAWDTAQLSHGTFISYLLSKRESSQGQFKLLDRLTSKSSMHYVDSSNNSSGFSEYQLECEFGWNNYQYQLGSITTIPLYLTGPESICTGDTFQIKINGDVSSLDSVIWDFGTGQFVNGGGFGPYYLYSDSATDIVVTTSIYSHCGVSVNQMSVQVKQSPEALITGPNYFCNGDTLDLIVSGQGAYFWNTGDTSNAISIDTLLTPQTFSVSVTSVNQCVSVDRHLVRPISTYENSNICLVTTDLINSLNQIYWVPEANVDIMAYKIFYADGNLPLQWVLFDSIGFSNSGLIIDSAHYAPGQQYSYALQVIDSCSDHSSLSPLSAPYFLQGVKSGNDVYLSWSPYQGFFTGNFIKIFRQSTLNGPFFLIDSVAIGNTDYADIGPPNSICSYYIESEGFICDSLFPGNPILSTTSNIVNVNTVGVKPSITKTCRVYFVNHQSHLGLEIEWFRENMGVAELNIFDGTGQLVQRKSLLKNHNEYIDLRYLNRGLYFYLLYDNEGILDAGKLVR